MPRGGARPGSGPKPKPPPALSDAEQTALARELASGFLTHDDIAKSHGWTRGQMKALAADPEVCAKVEEIRAALEDHGDDVRLLARGYAQRAMETLVALMTDVTEVGNTRLRAAERVLLMAAGAPPPPEPKERDPDDKALPAPPQRPSMVFVSNLNLTAEQLQDIATGEKRVTQKGYVIESRPGIGHTSAEDLI